MNETQDGAKGAHQSPDTSRSKPSSVSSSSEIMTPDSAPSSPVKRSAPSPTPTSPQEDLANKALEFLATATPGTLAGVGVGLAAVTYFVLRGVGLVLIGACGGVVLFAQWERQQPEVARAVRGEKAYDFLERILEEKKALADEKTEEEEENSAQLLARSFDDFQPETRGALNEFVETVVRDYVDWWYGPIVPSDRSFPFSCKKVLTNFILTVSNQLRRKRPADAFVDFLTHSCSIIIVFFSEMSNAYAELPSDSTLTAADAIYSYLAAHPESPLSNLLNQKQQASKFKMVADDLLGFLEKSTLDCDPARLFLRQIIATIILEGTLQSCSKPEWINGWIVHLLESGETDLSQAIDEAIENQRAFGDVDGNVGNIGLSRGNRSSYDVRRKEMAHKKKLSKADEEMEQAMEEMKRLNEMIAKADETKAPGTIQEANEVSAEASGLLDGALEDNAKDLDLNMASRPNGVITDQHQDLARQSDAGTTDGSTGMRTSKDESIRSPITPRSSTQLSSQNVSPQQKQEAAAPHQPFTSFDQFVPPAQEEPDEEENQKNAGTSLNHAVITVHDDVTNDKGRIRAKPTWEYLIQVEPSSSQQPGWMVMKKFNQFEALHESLRRIAAISGATAFLEGHKMFPDWKIHHRSSLRGEIERYLRAACAEKPLAESEALKRFLDKEQDTRVGPNRAFSFEQMGKGVLGAFQNAPKGALDGGKFVVGGMTGVFGNMGIGQKKPTNPTVQEIQSTESLPSTSSGRPLSLSALPRMDTSSSSLAGNKKARDSLDSQRSSVVSTQPGKLPPMERRPSVQVDVDDSLHPQRTDRWSMSGPSSRAHSRASSLAARRSPLRSPSETSLSGLKLPPPPHEMTDDYGAPSVPRLSTDGSTKLLSPDTTHQSPHSPSPSRSVPANQEKLLAQANAQTRRIQRKHLDLSENETRVAVELLFAVINELYTLSSAWNIRRTFLAAAKSYLLRPGNPSLTSIQRLVQTSVLDGNTTDDGLAMYIRKVRENSMPTDEERKAWPAEMTDEEKEQLRVKAKKLFMQSCVPATLVGIMGQSATNEALSRVFDCLQIEEIARGLFFGIILQAARVVTH